MGLMLTYSFLKIIHLLSVILFMGSIFFITYVVDSVKKQENSEFTKKISKKARSLMLANIPLLLTSGICILIFYYEFERLTLFMLLKLFISIKILIIFYISQKIIKKTNHIKWFHHFFHHAVFSMMVLVVILSQLM